MSSKQQSSIGKGYVQVYTGNGKGKTTAALGLAFRAMGYGLKTYIGQFMKGQNTVNWTPLKWCPTISPSNSTARKNSLILKILRRRKYGNGKNRPCKSQDCMLSGKYDIIILDEINTAYFFHLITIDEMLKFITEKPDGVELVFTGRYAPKELIDAADLVTEMVEVKHYYKKGITSRKGIED